MSYSFGCIKKCFTHKKNTRVEILNPAKQTNHDYSSSKTDIWATVVPKTFQAAQTPLGRQGANGASFSMPPPKRSSASPNGGNVKQTKDMPIDSLETMNPFTVPSSKKQNGSNSTTTMSIDINKTPPYNNETMPINLNALPKSDASLETMAIDFNNLPKADSSMETMAIDFNNLPKADPSMETMSIDFNNLPRAGSTCDTMSTLPDTMSIDFSNSSRADTTSMETMSILPETMSIDYNQVPTSSANVGTETMSINLNDIFSGSAKVEKDEEDDDDEDDNEEGLPEGDAYEEGIAGETLSKIRKAKISIVYEDENIEEIEKAIKEDIPIIKKVKSIKVNRETRERLQEVLLRKEWPLAFVKGDAVGGLDELRTLSETGVLTEWLKKHDYDLVVIGGGSGGLAAAKEAARLGKKVACLDFVKPSPQGSTWGLGGTCVNVGCIPKKLMHQASLLGHSIKDAKAFGWQIPEGQITHNWKNLKDGVQDHIASLNWGYRVQLREKLVNYVNAYGAFSGPFEISATNKKGKVEKLTADRFLIATGLRPRFPEIPGARENCITSDDLFALSYPPGKTLCVGASYVSLECAGFLKGIGFDVTVMVRSILLRGFDQDIAERIKAHMVEYGIKFERGIPSKIEEITPKTKQEAGLLRVYWNVKNEDDEEIECHEDYNTVVLAIGREAVIDDVKLETLGVTRSRNGKVLGRREQSLGCPYVYAIGDVLEYTPELTPVAIQAGRVLMRRLYLGSDELTEYDQIPTTVFTPLEYGCCGLSEEESYDKYGKDNIVVYHAVFNPLEYTIPERMDKDHCYCKLICVKNEKERIVGYHILTPSAGEVTQGFAIALKLGGRKRDFDRLIGIHPTIAENFTTLTLIKKEGEELKASGC